MVSSLSSLAALSSAELARLFGSTSLPPTASTSKSTDQAAPSNIALPGASTSATTIQTILAQVQISRAQTATTQGASAISATVQAAYAAETDTYEDGVTNSVAVGIAVGPGVTTTGVAFEQDGHIAGTSYRLSQSATSVSSTSLTDSTSDPAAEQTDEFQMALSFGNVSVTLGFAVEGLGKVTTQAVGGAFNVGNGGSDDRIQLLLSGGGYGVGFDVDIDGLDQAQAQRVSAAFKKAVSQVDTTALGRAGYQLSTEQTVIPDLFTPATIKQ